MNKGRSRTLSEVYRHYPTLKPFTLEALHLVDHHHIEILLNTHDVHTAIPRQHDPVVRAVQHLHIKQGCFFLSDLPISDIRQHTFVNIRGSTHQNTLILYRKLENQTWILTITGNRTNLNTAFAAQHLRCLFKIVNMLITRTRTQSLSSVMTRRRKSLKQSRYQK